MKLLVIVGPPGSGKTTLAKELAKEQSLYIIHTDDFIERGEQALLKRLALSATMGHEGILLEGCWTAKVLREMVERGIVPYKIIKMETPLDICIERYEQREGKDYPRGMFSMVHTFFDRFLEWCPDYIRDKIDIVSVG